MPHDKLPVIEVFGPTLQGEGALIGQKSHFIRFGGCGYRCSWCDSMHAVDPQQIKANARWMDEDDILLEVTKPDFRDGGKLWIDALKTPWVTLSGGDPLMWNLEVLCEMLHSGPGYKIAVETQGQLYKPWVSWCDRITVSPKPPSSGMADKLDHTVLKLYAQNLGDRTVFKVPCFDDDDLDFAQAIHQSYPKVPFYITVGTPQACPTFQGLSPKKSAALAVCLSLAEIAEKVLARPQLQNVIVLPQMHVLIWGHAKGK